MCFRINHKAKRPRKKYVWKIVLLEYGGTALLKSPWYPNKAWQPGETQRIARSAKTHNQSYYTGHTFARAGIYVYLDEDDALTSAKRNWGNAVVIRLRVDPKDCLFSGLWCKATVATYRAATPTERQPHIEWY